MPGGQGDLLEDVVGHGQRNGVAVHAGVPARIKQFAPQ
jgi:hypothetical protein